MSEQHMSDATPRDPEGFVALDRATISELQDRYGVEMRVRARREPLSRVMGEAVTPTYEAYPRRYPYPPGHRRRRRDRYDRDYYDRDRYDRDFYDRDYYDRDRYDRDRYDRDYYDRNRW